MTEQLVAIIIVGATFMVARNAVGLRYLAGGDKPRPYKSLL